MNPDSTQTRSVFDRLIDASYARDLERYDERNLVLSIESDLEQLLNSRQTFQNLDSFPELQKSIMGYGLPDANAFDLETPSARCQLAQTIEAVIQQFEPRVSNVRVEFLETAAQIHCLNMQICATLNSDSGAELAFETTLKLATGHYVINSSSSPNRPL